MLKTHVSAAVSMGPASIQSMFLNGATVLQKSKAQIQSGRKPELMGHTPFWPLFSHLLTHSLGMDPFGDSIARGHCVLPPE